MQAEARLAQPQTTRGRRKTLPAMIAAEVNKIAWSAFTNANDRDGENIQYVRNCDNL